MLAAQPRWTVGRWGAAGQCTRADRRRSAQCQPAEGRASEHLPGTGLGLAISQAIVRQLGGTISLDERYRDGAAFDILLPVDVDGAAGVAAA